MTSITAYRGPQPPYYTYPGSTPRRSTRPQLPRLPSVISEITPHSHMASTAGKVSDMPDTEPPLTPLQHLEDEHTREAIGIRLAARSHSYLRDFIYGSVDGTVTTFAIVAGAMGANLAGGIAVVLGLTNLAADGFSMAVSNFLGTRAERQETATARLREHAHIAALPEGEREEIRQIFARKGFQGPDLDRVVEVITNDPHIWVETMVSEELGLQLHGASPLRAGGSTLIAFVLAGAVPLTPYLILLAPGVPRFDPFPISAIMAGLTFFAIGALKGRFVITRWHISGIETLAVGGAAAAIAYGAGMLLRQLTDRVF
jgi:VIT1/CCC1 family predicted Fe2+/Mn2+ transporter